MSEFSKRFNLKFKVVQAALLSAREGSAEVLRSLIELAGKYSCFYSYILRLFLLKFTKSIIEKNVCCLLMFLVSTLKPTNLFFSFV